MSDELDDLLNPQDRNSDELLEDVDPPVNPGTTPQETDLDDVGSDVSWVDKQLQTTKVLQKEITKKHKTTEFNGRVLDVEEIGYQQLLYETSDAFAREIAGDYDPNKAKTGEKPLKIKKIRVYIAELQGFLPMPSKIDLLAYRNLKKKFNAKSGGLDAAALSEEEKKLTSWCKKTLSRVTPFYTTDSAVSVFSDAKVLFSDQNYMFFGKFIGKVGS